MAHANYRMHDEAKLSMTVHPDDTDSSQFVRHIAQFIDVIVEDIRPPRFCVIKVDNWFGPKWLAFSHKAMGAFGVASQDLVIPPFVPNRILSEKGFTRIESGAFAPDDTICPFHVEQTHHDNTARKLSTHYPDAPIFWWSGRSAFNGRGSFMAYVCGPEGHTPWYVELIGPDTWHPSVKKGISSAALERYMGTKSVES